MAIDDLVTVAKFFDSQQAGMARALLNSHGIAAVIQGGEMNAVLGYIGPTVGGVELQVTTVDADRAEEILAAFHEKEGLPAAGEDWTCSRCGEHVEGGFEVCWSCGASFDEIPKEHESPSTPRPVVEKLSEEEELKPDDEVLPNPDQEAYRAFRLAVIGIIFPPFLFYALFVLLGFSTEKLSKKGLVQYYQALTITILFLAMWVGIFAGF